MFVDVRVFDDERRIFQPANLNTANVNLIYGRVLELFGSENGGGPKGGYLCRKVMMPGTVVFVAAEDVEKLTQ